MKRLFASGVILAAVGAVLAAPEPADSPQKPVVPDADRVAAEWVIANGGTIRTAAGTFGKGDPLGDGPFKITAISLGSTDKVKDDDLARFKDLTKLNNLSLANTPIGDAGLKHLTGLKSLESLYLPNTKVGDAGLVHLKGMTGLVNLYLDETKVTDAGLEHLIGMKGLSVLYLRHTQITDTGLKQIKAMPKLCWLDLWGTKVTDAGVRELQAALPRCTIKNVDPKNDRPPPPAKANQPAEARPAAIAAPEKTGQPAGQPADARAASPAEIEVTFDWKGEKRTRKVLVLDLGGGEKIEFVRIPAGKFQMGSPESDKNETADKKAYDWEKQHEVVISHDYYIARYALTKGQFARFVDAVNYRTEPERDGEGGWGYDATADKLGQKSKYTWKNTGWEYTERHPVVNVTWNDATKFCDWASNIVQEKKDGLRLSGAWSVRLPTEAEWEYSCRGGTTTRWFTGNEPGSLEGYANLADVSAKKIKAIAKAIPEIPQDFHYADYDDGYAFAAPVGRFKPNPFGLYDMAGNVWQWCQDVYGSAPNLMPAFRGGCWSGYARDCRSGNPRGYHASHRQDNLGFRPALVPSALAPSRKKVEEVDPEKEPKAGEEREFEIAIGVKMKFCWIPPGEAQLGSPKTERETVLKQLIEARMVDNGKEPEWLSEESDGARVKFKTKGFWFGKFTVTQAEWKAVMGDNPSFFQLLGIGKDALQKDGIQDTSHFPVEQVSWDDCQKFLEKLNKRTEVEKVFGKAGQFALPHEDQWEYACRGGKGNEQAFYFGNELNGTQANCNGNEPYGTDKKGEWKQRTTEVGSYAKDWPHPWGLCDMHGNVWQLCNNKYGHSNDRVLRGGSWYFGARDCRTAYRWDEPVRRYYINGFRVCLPLDK